MSANDVLNFWFGDYKAPESVPANELKWFRKSDAFDEAIRSRFLQLWTEAASGGLVDWEDDPSSRLALILILDQFSRNLFRDSATAFAQDERAAGLTRRTLKERKDHLYLPFQRTFLYLPLEHSESMADQNLSVSSFERLLKEVPESLKKTFEENLQYAVTHRDIVARFGRFPHRNAVLKRESTPEEIEFLKDRLSFY